MTEQSIKNNPGPDEWYKHGFDVRFENKINPDSFFGRFLIELANDNDEIIEKINDNATVEFPELINTYVANTHGINYLVLLNHEITCQFNRAARQINLRPDLAFSAHRQVIIYASSFVIQHAQRKLADKAYEMAVVDIVALGAGIINDEIHLHYQNEQAKLYAQLDNGAGSSGWL